MFCGLKCWLIHQLIDFINSFSLRVPLRAPKRIYLVPSKYLEIKTKSKNHQTKSLSCQNNI